MSAPLLLPILVPWMAACQPPSPGETLEALPDDDLFELGPVRGCEAPYTGRDRLADEAAERRVTEPLADVETVLGQPAAGTGGQLVLHDLDADGDLDLLTGGLDGRPQVYANDGAGFFTLVDDAVVHHLGAGRGVLAWMAADLDGDALRELVLSAVGKVVVYRNLGGLRWSQGEVVLDEPGARPWSC